MADIAISMGRSAGSIRSMSMTTDVSTSPRGGRGSATGCHGLIDESVHIPAKAPAGHGRSIGKRGVREFGRHERTLSEGYKLPDRPPISCDDEGLATVKGAHDPPAVVSQFTLRNPAAHSLKCSTRATPMPRGEGNESFLPAFVC
jgi:hypothetical protein